MESTVVNIFILPTMDIFMEPISLTIDGFKEASFKLEIHKSYHEQRHKDQKLQNDSRVQRELEVR